MSDYISTRFQKTFLTNFSSICFEYLNIRHIHRTFYELNKRRDNLVLSFHHVALRLLPSDDTNDPVVEFFVLRIYRMTLIDGHTYQINLSHFRNIRSLINHCSSNFQLLQIRSEVLPLSQLARSWSYTTLRICVF